jgi:hypothetical protein
MGRMSTMQAPPVKLTSDLSWGFFQRLFDKWGPSAVGLLEVMQSEAGMHSSAHNPGGATGLIQFEPDTLAGLGWHQTMLAFAGLSAEEQLPWVEKYFATRRVPPKLPATGTDFYVDTFLPVDEPHAEDPSFVLAKQGDGIYEANAVFDKDHKGTITIDDLTAAIQRNASGARWQEALARLEFIAGGGSPTAGEIAGAVVGACTMVGGLAYLAWEAYRRFWA